MRSVLFFATVLALGAVFFDLFRLQESFSAKSIEPPSVSDFVTPVPLGTVAGSAVEVPSDSARERAVVEKIIDGDTVELSDGRVVRYIGIDTPETKHPTKPIGCWGLQAHQRNSELVAGKVIFLEKDRSETDRYGRLLRYVYSEGVMVNETLVREGHAIAKAYKPDITKQSMLLAAQVFAQEQHVGIWSPVCQLQATPVVSVTTESLGMPALDAAGEAKQCAYTCEKPDKDCSDFPSIGQAQSFFDCCGFTADYDPMRLDGIGVGDGKACQ